MDNNENKKKSKNEETVIIKEDDSVQTTPKGEKKPPYLIIIDGPNTGSFFPLNSNEKNSIGRSAESQIALQDASVSRRHSELEKTDAGWRIIDFDSKNGTFVNGNIIKESVIVGHKDLIKTGIYLLRMVTQNINPEEEMQLPPEIISSEKTIVQKAANHSEGATSEIKEEEINKQAQEQEIEEDGQAEVDIVEPPKRNIKKYVFFGLAFLSIIIMIGFLTSKFFLHPKTKGSKKADAENVSTKTDKSAAIPVENNDNNQSAGKQDIGPSNMMVGPPAPKKPSKLPVFLDFASSPLPATVKFDEKELGKTPLRVNLELKPDKSYSAEAVFLMPELSESYKLPVSFEFNSGDSVIPILFRAPIGMIKINDLPRDVQFYLEGSYEYDRFKERPAKLNEIVLQKPIYVPYGSYSIELRRSRQLGESETFVQDIIFRREFKVAEDKPTYVLEVVEEDLKKFPVSIKSDPNVADVFIDGKLMGKTPYKGEFPLGDHKLTLRKEGYFENTQDLKVDINMPFVADVKLDTTLSGTHINTARGLMNKDFFQEAINELAQALSSEPVEPEVNQINFLLGKCYLNVGDYDRALNYFSLSEKSEEWKYPSMLGQIAVYATTNNVANALPILVTVLLKTDNEELKKEANDLFQKISPLRSVVYAYTEPAGATVIVNDKKVEYPSPVILHDLPLGTYKLKFEKAGYETTELKLTLTVNEFNPVIVKLKPISD